VQESVTNILRHSGAREASIEVVAGARGELAVTVADDGAATASSSGDDWTGGSGVGLQGMRERARASGGRLVVGRIPQGGFRVRATWDAGR
jgi:signal transduction histidine kinase